MRRIPAITWGSSERTTSSTPSVVRLPLPCRCEPRHRLPVRRGVQALQQNIHRPFTARTQTEQQFIRSMHVITHQFCVACITQYGTAVFRRDRPRGNLRRVALRTPHSPRSASGPRAWCMSVRPCGRPLPAPACVPWRIRAGRGVADHVLNCSSTITACLTWAVARIFFGHRCSLSRIADLATPGATKSRRCLDLPASGLKIPPLPDAGIAQLVERNLAKVEVASSSLVSRSSDFNMKPLRSSWP